MAQKQQNFLRSITRVAMGRTDVLLASFTINMLTLALPLIILQVYDRIIPQQATDTFVIMMFGLFVVLVIDLILRLIRSRITTWSAARFEHATGGRAIDRLLSSRLEFFEADPPGKHLDRLASVEALRDFHSGQALIALSDLPFVLLFLFLIGLIGNFVVLAPIAIGIAALIFAILMAKKLDEAVFQRTELDNERYNFIFQILNGIHSVKGLGLEAQMCRQYEQIHGRIAGAVKDLTYFSTIAQSVGSMFSNLTMVSVAIIGGVLVVQGDLSNGSLVACILLSGRAVQPLLRMIGVWVQTRNLRLAEQRLDDLLSLEQENRPLGDADLTPDLTGWIKLENVSLTRNNSDEPILKKIDLEILPGEMVALRGDNESARTLVLDLISGLMEPSEGHLYFDDVDSKSIDFHKLREEIAYVRQFSVLYNGTLLENLTAYKGKERISDALEIAEKLGLDRMIANLPDGLHTKVGDSASEALPGSMQQLIALTRALASKPKILLFDEANSAFDFKTDDKLRQLLLELRGRMTIIMITGRPSLAKIADRFIEIEDGRILSDHGGSEDG